jgi:Domain of unknown function (DUF6249)
MMHIFESIIPITLFIIIGLIIKWGMDHKTRRLLIEKGMVDEKLKYLFNEPPGSLSSMKWGMVLIGIGLALFIGQIFSSDLTEEATMGLMFLFAGLGFIIYYFMAKSKMSDADSKK